MIAILDRLKEEKKNSENQDKEQLEQSNSLEDDGDWDKDDTDEGIIYIKWAEKSILFSRRCWGKWLINAQT